MRVLPLALVLLATGLPAQWLQRNPTVVPPAREGAAMVSTSSGVLLFGGRDAVSFRNDLFGWGGLDWEAIPTMGGPSPRANHRMARDPGRNVVLLFGGEPLSAETWELDLQSFAWTRLLPANVPVQRHSHVLAFDSTRSRFVLFGGFLGPFGLNDTWEFDGTNWTLMGTPTIPSPRGDCAAAFDPVHNEVVVFGGSDFVGGTRLAETWTYDGVDWTLRSLIGPAPRVGAAMAFDAARGKVVMFGGRDGGTMDETWEWDGAAWSRLTLSGPSGRRGHALAHHAAPGLNLMFGGSSGGAETWWLNVAQEPSFFPIGNGCGLAPAPTLTKLAGSQPVLGSTLALQIVNLRAQLTTFGVIGFSGTFTGGTPLPRSLTFAGFPAGCMQFADAEAFLLLSAAPAFANWNIPIPNRPFLAGLDFYVQSLQIDNPSLMPAGTSNGAQAIIGAGTPLLSLLRETFASNAFRDPLTSSGAWGGGTLQPGRLGGDGLHGSFDPSIGTQVAPGVFEFDTDNTVIPARMTLSGVPVTVTNGQFLFSDLDLPAGVTVRFKGSNPALLRVRGRANVTGTLQANAEAMTGFQSRNRFSTALHPGQPGGVPGPGGGRGGQGGDRCSGTGPTIVAGVNTNDGQPGENVQLPAGHAFAGMQVGTGGRGSLLWPPSGLNSAIIYRVSFGAFSGMIAAGGGGGGYSGPGAAGMAVSSPSPPPNAMEIGPPSMPGTPLSLFPVPAGTSSLDHFTVGGSGGGGGGSHPFLAVILAFPDTWKSGAGGSGGGGAVALRTGGDATVTGSLEAKGGDGFFFSDQNLGIPAPGGGGSGGTVLVQSGGRASVQGTVDTSGGPGSSTGNISPVNLNGVTQGGAGAPGMIRVESQNVPNLGGATLVPPQGPNTVGTLSDVDARTGDRSLWYSPAAGVVPTYVRYELDATINGVPTTFSDDPMVGPPANLPTGPVRIRFQGTAPDPLGNPDPSEASPWRDSVAQLNGGRAAFLRFDIVFDRTTTMAIVADEVRVVFR